MDDRFALTPKTADAVWPGLRSWLLAPEGTHGVVPVVGGGYLWAVEVRLKAIAPAADGA